jgi:NosR/NirI family transcriptional regulator, nitrous oxide reductase regulator
MPATLAAPIVRYARWLHTRWPAGTVESLPEVRADGSTSVPGLFIVGDLTGIPLLKFAVDTGARVVGTILADPRFERERRGRRPGVRDLVIIGAGVSGMSAALEARKAGLDFVVFEAKRPFQTIADFPKAKPIYTYPHDLDPAGELKVTAEVKEALYDELLSRTRGIPVTEARVESVASGKGVLAARLADGGSVEALRVIVAIGRSGNFRRLGVPGEDLDKVYNRLHDPSDFQGREVLVIGGGDSALETAIALARGGAAVTLSYRGAEFSKPKPENLENLMRLAADPAAEVMVLTPASERVTTAAGPFLEKSRSPGSLRIELRSRVVAIHPQSVEIERADSSRQSLPNDVVFSMIGREAPLEFFRRSRVPIAGEWSAGRVASLALFMLFCLALYDWKSGGFLDELSRRAGAFPYSLSNFQQGLDPHSLAGIVLISAQGPSFWYTLAYSAIVVVFGIRRIRKRRTPYVRLQTLTLMAIQILPLFLLPEIVLPWLDGRGLLPAALADALFPKVTYGHGREFWRAYGLILAWPLNVYNVFTASPLWAWLAICFAQTFILIPALIYFYGKGAYCGWICSCGALAETLGDEHRHKMPHGSRWNRLNLAGQGILAVAVVLLILRIAGWCAPGWPGLRWWNDLALSGSALSYKWVVDVFLAGVVGYGVYFWLSGRVWCRFFCPLAALMHVYARFSRFRILAEKKKCISCNVCTSVCHQGIDVMNFANKGIPMADPECVRCSACVSSCPTGVLSFGQVSRDGKVIRVDRLQASPVQMREG